MECKDRYVRVAGAYDGENTSIKEFDMNGNIDRFVDVIICGAVIAVIIFKLVGIITIPWLWLTSIIWIPFLFGIVLTMAIMGLYLIERFIKKEK